MDIGKDAAAVKATYQLMCPVCGKPAIRRENSRAGVAYLHLTKHGSKRCFIGKEETARGTKRKDPATEKKKKEGERRAG